MAKDTKKSGKSTENTEEIAAIGNESANNTGNTDNIESASVLSKAEFMERLMTATKKHAPEDQKFESEEEAEKAFGYFTTKMGRRISHLCPENTQQVVELVELMYKGEYQNDKMLVLIEEMPENGYGHE